MQLFAVVLQAIQYPPNDVRQSMQSEVLWVWTCCINSSARIKINVLLNMSIIKYNSLGMKKNGIKKHLIIFTKAIKGAIIRGNLSPRIPRGETNRCGCHRPGRRIALHCDIGRAIAHLRAVNAESTHLTRSQSIHLKVGFTIHSLRQGDEVLLFISIFLWFKGSKISVLPSYLLPFATNAWLQYLHDTAKTIYLAILFVTHK